MLVSLIGSSFGSNAGYSHRTTRVHLLYRKAREFESDARIRFTALEESNLEERLGAFQAVIADIAESSARPVRQLERIAEILESGIFAASLSETFTNILVDLVSITNIDLMAYPGIFESEERQSFLARLLNVASRIGLSRTAIHSLLREENGEERLGAIERHLELVSQSPDDDISVRSFRRLLGLPGAVLGMYDIRELENFAEINHDITSPQVRLAWEEVQRDVLFHQYSNLEGIVILEEMWGLVNAAYTGLWKVPFGYRNMEAEIFVFISALSDLGVLLKNENLADAPEQVAINDRIISKLRPLIPILQGYTRDALDELLSEKRSQMIQKIKDSLPQDARIIFEPFLLYLMDRHLIYYLRPEFNHEDVRAILTSFLEIQVDGLIAAIQVGEARISVSHFLNTSNLTTPYWEISKSEAIWGRILHITYEFARRFGVAILAIHHRPEWQTERIANFRLVVAACLQLGCTDVWESVASSTDIQLVEIVSVLHRIVERRNFLLSLNEDDPAASVIAEEWIRSFLSDDTVYAAEWISEKLIIPSQFRPLLRQVGFLREIMGNVLTYFELPDRLGILFRKFASVRRRLGRSLTLQGDPRGTAAVDAIKLSDFDVRGILLRIELKRGVVDENSSVLIEIIDMLDMAANQLLRNLLSAEKASNFIKALKDLHLPLVFSDPRRGETLTDWIASFAAKITFAARIVRAKEILLE